MLIAKQVSSMEIVSKVSDGDTIHVLYENKTIKIRLSHIDAPERKQAHGIKSQKFLEDMDIK